MFCFFNMRQLFTAFLFLCISALLLCTHAAADESKQAYSLVFGTYLGGSNLELTQDSATDLDGNIYITGGTESKTFRTTAGIYSNKFQGQQDVFVAKFNQRGKLVWSTLIGGPNYDRANAIEVDSSGYVYIAGQAGAGFPVTKGVVQSDFAGDSSPSSLFGQQDAFVAKISPDGKKLIWATYLGGEGSEFASDMALDKSGAIYLALNGSSGGFPHITPSSFQTKHKGKQDGVIAKLTPDAARVVYASYIGGREDDGFTPSIRVDELGNAYYLMGTNSENAPVSSYAFQREYGGGTDLHLTKISADGSSIIYASYFGGSSLEGVVGNCLELDSQGRVYIAALSKSFDLPAGEDAFQQTNFSGPGPTGGDAVIAKISEDGSAIIAMTYFGGSHDEVVEGLAIDFEGNIYIGGTTQSSDFPTTASALEIKHSGDINTRDAYVAKFTSDLSVLLYSTFLGGSKHDLAQTLAVDAKRNIILGGITNSSDFILKNATQDTHRGRSDVFLSKLRPDFKSNAPEGSSLVPQARRLPADGAPIITGFALLDVETGEEITAYDPIPNGAEISLQSLPEKRLAIRADAIGSVKSVRFELNDASNSRIENAPPFSLTGDKDGKYNSFPYVVGQWYTLRATPHSETAAEGQAGGVYEIRFRFVE